MKEATPIKIWTRPEDNWGNEYNQFDAYGIQFDGAGDMGVFSVVKGNNPKFKIGESAHYDIKDKGKHPAKITFIDPQYSDQPTQEFGTPVSKGFDIGAPNNVISFDTRLIIREVCIKAASVFCAGRTPVDWENTANDMYSWVIKSETIEAKEIVKLAGLTPEEMKAIIDKEEEDSIPF